MWLQERPLAGWRAAQRIPPSPDQAGLTLQASSDVIQNENPTLRYPGMKLKITKMDGTAVIALPEALMARLQLNEGDEFFAMATAGWSEARPT